MWSVSVGLKVGSIAIHLSGWGRDCWVKFNGLALEEVQFASSFRKNVLAIDALMYSSPQLLRAKSLRQMVICTFLRCMRSWESHEAFTDELQRLKIMGSIVFAIFQRLICTVCISTIQVHWTLSPVSIQAHKFHPFNSICHYHSGSIRAHLFHSFHLTLSSISLPVHPLHSFDLTLSHRF